MDVPECVSAMAVAEAQLFYGYLLILHTTLVEKNRMWKLRNAPDFV